MITRAIFKQIMGQLETNVEWCSRLSEVFGDTDLVYEHASIDEVVYAIAAAFSDGPEYDELQSLLFRWIFAADFGKVWDDEETSMWGADMSTVDGLYDYLLGGNNPQEKADYTEEYQTVFEVPSDLAGCPDFELTYHPDDKYYSMSMETIYRMDVARARAYIQDILGKFTAWMQENGRDTTCPLYLDVFTDGLSIGRCYHSIEAAYAHFAAFARGVLAQGVKCWDYEVEEMMSDE